MLAGGAPRRARRHGDPPAKLRLRSLVLTSLQRGGSSFARPVSATREWASDRAALALQSAALWSGHRRPRRRIGVGPSSTAGCRSTPPNLAPRSSGGGGIRTHERLATPTVFETAPFNRSGTPPGLKQAKSWRRLFSRERSRERNPNRNPETPTTRTVASSTEVGTKQARRSCRNASRLASEGGRRRGLPWKLDASPQEHADAGSRRSGLPGLRRGDEALIRACPPKGVGNTRRVEMLGLEDWLRREEEGAEVKPTISQKGSGAYSLCRDCNSRAGELYVPESQSCTQAASKLFLNSTCRRSIAVPMPAIWRSTPRACGPAS